MTSREREATTAVKAVDEDRALSGPRRDTQSKSEHLSMDIRADAYNIAVKMMPQDALACACAINAE